MSQSQIWPREEAVKEPRNRKAFPPFTSAMTGDRLRRLTRPSRGVIFNLLWLDLSLTAGLQHNSSPPLSTASHPSHKTPGSPPSPALCASECAGLGVQCKVAVSPAHNREHNLSFWHSSRPLKGPNQRGGGGLGRHVIVKKSEGLSN